MRHDIQKGDFLLAEPFMQDPNFKRAVIYLTEHDSDGSFGLVLNRPSVFTVNEVLPDFPKIRSHMYLGGPVGLDRLNFLHAYGDIIPKSHHIKDNIWWNGDYDVLKSAVAEKIIMPHNIKFFIGYSGWGPEQIDDEMDDKSWIISKGNTKIFSNAESMWKDILFKMGGAYRIMANYPEDPSLN
jgi:putative transcriptional regulator